MNIDLLPLSAFVLVTTFTPGPGNITSAAMGMMYGYRRTFRFLSGIVAGYLMIMILCSFLSSKLLVILPAVEPVLRITGACYILWLAVNTARAQYNFSQENTPPMHFKHGFLLQALNPKAIIFGLTMYTTFLSGITGSPLPLAISTVLLATLTFCSVSLWAFGGVQIQRYLHLKQVRRSINLILFILLLYCAVTLSGIF
jgi:cysteine/O-acetylserine efflux protein